MIQILKNNIPWIFSGVGVAVLVYFLQGKPKKQNNNLNNENSPGSSNQQNNANVIIQNNYNSAPSTNQKPKTSNPESPVVMIEKSKLDQKNSYHTDPTPTEISKQLNKLPPYQQEKMSEEYKNFKIAWKVRLHSVSSALKEGMVTVVASEIGNTFNYPMINFDVNISSCPKLKFSQRGEIMSVFGEIKKASLTWFELKNCSIEFEKNN